MVSRSRDRIEGKWHELRGAIIGDKAEEARGKALGVRASLKTQAAAKLQALKDGLTGDKATRARRKAARAADK